MGGILLSGCASLSKPGIDPHFAGYHGSNPTYKLTPAIPDRDVHVEALEVDSSEELALMEAVDEPTVEASRYRNYYRDPYYGSGGFRFNLSYHLYGPNHYRSPRSRAWLAHQRRWSRLPWYADPYSSYFWWNDPLYGFGYDPWYVDPWYYDPWHYDPYGGYGYAYNYYGGWSGGWWHGGYGGSSWYGDGQQDSGSDQVQTRRPRNRRGLPTGPGPGLTADMQLGNAMTGVAGSKSGNVSSGMASATTKSKGSTTRRKWARGANRRERAAKPSKERSTSGSSASTRSTRSSKSSSSSSSGKTARPRNRKN